VYPADVSAGGCDFAGPSLARPLVGSGVHRQSGCACDCLALGDNEFDMAIIVRNLPLNARVEYVSVAAAQKVDFIWRVRPMVESLELKRDPCRRHATAFV
jgi:hypothetical protein